MPPAAAATRGGGALLPARRVLVEAGGVAGVGGGAERRAGRHRDGRARADAQAGRAAAEHVDPLLLPVRDLLGGGGLGLEERAVVRRLLRGERGCFGAAPEQ